MKKLKKVNVVLAILLFLFVSATGFSQILDVPECTQEYDQWCWAGSSWSVLQYYGNDFQQCEIAEYTRTHSEFHDFGSVNCCLPDTTPGWACNYWNYNYDPDPGSIKMILIDIPIDIGNPSITNTGIGSMLSESETAAEIAAGRPFVIRICCGGHFVVGRGYQSGNLYYMDPWYGEGYGYGPFGSVVNGRDWTHTNKISLDPGPSCGVPQNLQATNITDDSATLSWSSVTSADYYRYRYKPTTSGTWTTNTTSSTSVGISGLSTSTDYEFQVQTECPSATSNYSSSATFTTLSNLPPAANFTGSPTGINEGQSVNFTDTSANMPTSWSWSFPGGTPSSSTAQDPTITYNTAGVYNVTLTATNANGNDSETKTNYITVTEIPPFFGNSTVFSTTTNAATRRAVLYTMPEDGTIISVTQYHDGGSGNMILGVYDGASAPNNRLGVTPTTAVNAATGWQTINLQTPVFVSSGVKVWLAWVYETNPNVYYQTGTPGRVDAGVAWSGGMPDPYGSGTEADYIYSIYASYTPGGTPAQYTLTTNTVGQGSITLNPSGGTYNEGTVVTVTANPDSSWQFDNWSGDLGGSTNPTTITMNANKSITANFSETTSTYTVGNTAVFGSSTTTANRRAMPYTMPENGTISSISMYHTGGSGNMILGLYDGSSPTNRLGVTSTTAVSGTTGWQTINLQSPAFVAGGATFWLAWVFESNPGIYYESGSPGRRDAGEGWAGGMPDPYGSSTQSNYIYSVYATYTPGGTPTQYTLTTNTSGQGSITLNPSGGTYNEGTVVTVTANPSSGWQFDNWSGALSGSTNPTTITMNSNKSITANFSESGSSPYCDSYGLNSATYIDNVEFGSFTNASGAAGYTDFTNLTVNMAAGGSVSYRIDKGDSNSSGFRVWIDFNGDGDFDDSGEQVVSTGMWNNYCTGSFSVPSGLNLTTRMRVSVKRNNYSTPCEVFSYGEVEDYTVVIQ